MPTTQLRAALVHALSQTARERPPLATEPPPASPKHSAGRSLEAALIGEDPRMRGLDLARGAAAIRNPVLLVGEAGTGKSLLARVIHELGRAHNGPFLELGGESGEHATLEDVLFGSPRDRVEVGNFGRPPLAHGGTLVLDETAAPSPALQLKLHMILRDASDGSPPPVRSGRVDVRLILTGPKEGARDTPLEAFWQSV